MKKNLGISYWMCVKIIAAVAIIFSLIFSSQLKLDLFYVLLRDPIHLMVIIFLCFMMVFLQAWRWYRLNCIQKIRLSYINTILPTYVGIALNYVLPGGVGGDFVRLFYVLKKFPEQKTAATLSIIVDRVNGLMGILLILCVLLPHYVSDVRFGAWSTCVLASCVAVLFVSMAIFFGLGSICVKKVTTLNSLRDRCTNLIWLNRILSWLDLTDVYKGSRLIILENWAISITTQLLLLVVIVMICKMTHLPMVSIQDFALALMIAQIASLLPLTPGGIGVGEAAFANVIYFLNPEITAAYATVYFALRIISTMAYLPGALLSVYGLKVRQEQPV